MEENQARFVGRCRLHEWESMRRESRQEAQADLDAHIATYPDESHAGAQVEQC
jgi:hypothetical protein